MSQSPGLFAVMITSHAAVSGAAVGTAEGRGPKEGDECLGACVLLPLERRPGVGKILARSPGVGRVSWGWKEFGEVCGVGVLSGSGGLEGARLRVERGIFFLGWLCIVFFS